MLKFVLGSVLTSLVLAAHAGESAKNVPIEGIGLDRTRVVIEDGASSGTFGLINDIGSPVIVTAWVTDLDGKMADAFVASPSLYQLANGKTGKGTVRLVSQLPQDRESVFWLNVNTAPAVQSRANQLAAAIGTRIKIFYRPDGLAGDARYAAERLRWSLKSNALHVDNPTALSVSVSDVTVNGRTERVAQMVMPFSKLQLPVGKPNPEAGGVNTFTFVDEYGGFNELAMRMGAP